jgi:hypothetical protein
MANYPEVGGRITLTNFLSARTAEARVLATPYSREGVAHGIIVELVTPDDSFWGVGLQVKKTQGEIHLLEQCLLSEGIDMRLLGEFREAAEFLRSASSAVPRLRERQLQGREDDDIQAQVTCDRLRRATNLCLEVANDLETGKVRTETKGSEELYRALMQVSERLGRLVARTEKKQQGSSR